MTLAYGQERFSMSGTVMDLEVRILKRQIARKTEECSYGYAEGCSTALGKEVES